MVDDIGPKRGVSHCGAKRCPFCTPFSLRRSTDIIMAAVLIAEGANIRSLPYSVKSWVALLS